MTLASDNVPISGRYLVAVVGGNRRDNRVKWTERATELELELARERESLLHRLELNVEISLQVATLDQKSTCPACNINDAKVIVNLI